MEMKNNKKRPNSFLLKMVFVLVFFGVQVHSFAQQDPEKAAREARKFMTEAEEALSENDFASAEAYYRQAIAKDPANAAARYNLGNLYYNKEINYESIERHAQAAEVAPEKPIKHNSFHNQGNAFMKQKKYREAIEAYKNALRNNPGDDETRYNLALAKKMLEEEKEKGGGDDEENKDQNQDQQDQNEDQNQEKDQQGDQGEQEQNKDGEPQDDEQGDEQDKQDPKEGDDKEGEEGEPKDPQNNENKDQKGDKPEDQQQQQPRPGQLSPQQVKNLLEAMGNEEKKVQDKINAEKAKGAKTKSEKDW